MLLFAIGRRMEWSDLFNYGVPLVIMVAFGYYSVCACRVVWRDVVLPARDKFFVRIDKFFSKLDATLDRMDERDTAVAVAIKQHEETLEQISTILAEVHESCARLEHQLTGKSPKRAKTALPDQTGS